MIGKPKTVLPNALLFIANEDLTRAVHEDELVAFTNMPTDFIKQRSIAQALAGQPAEVPVTVNYGIGDIAFLWDVDAGQDSVVDKAQVAGDVMWMAIRFVDFARGGDAEVKHDRQAVAMDFATFVPGREEILKLEVSLPDKQLTLAGEHESGAVGIVDEAGFKDVVIDGNALRFIRDDAHWVSFS